MDLIDTHQHLFYPDVLDYPWLADFDALNEPHPVERYLAEAGPVQPTGTVFMECDVAESDMAKEAKFMYAIAEKAPVPMLGVIASCRPERVDFGDYLDEIAHPLLVGVRRVLHVVPDETSEGPLFVPNLQQLAKRDLTFDLCVRADQLGIALRLATSVPELQFILDHCGCPALDGSNFTDWKRGIDRLAALSNVACKVSGLTAYGDREQVNQENLFRTMDAVFEAFGADRLVWGGDWPVCTLNSSLADWIAISTVWAGNLAQSERDTLFAANARRFYGLPG